ncbi:MAG: alpha/beta fold hydrolase [Salinarchaeum sp.]
MPWATNDGVKLYYERHGTGPPVVLVPTLGFGPWQWAWQHSAVVGPFSAIVYHGRRTGRSEASPGTDTIDDLVGDLEAVLAAADVRRAHAVGMGLGGTVALEYAHQHDRLRSLVLVGTPAGGADMPSGKTWLTMAATKDDRTALESTTREMVSTAFCRDHPEVIAQIVAWRGDEDATLNDWEATAAAVDGYQRDWPLYEMTLPTLVVHGGSDAVVPSASADRLATDLPRATTRRFPDAGHLVTVERSRPLNDQLVGFLDEHASVER